MTTTTDVISLLYAWRDDIDSVPYPDWVSSVVAE